MRTSISNKIVVIFLTLTIAISFSLIIYFYYTFASYDEKQNQRLVKTTLNVAWEYYCDAVDSEIQKATYAIDNLEANEEGLAKAQEMASKNVVASVGIRNTDTGTSYGVFQKEMETIDGTSVIDNSLVYVTKSKNKILGIVFTKDFMTNVLSDYQVKNISFKDYGVSKEYHKVAYSRKDTAASFYHGNVCLSFNLVRRDEEQSSVINSIILLCLLILIATMFLSRFLVNKVSSPLEYIIDNINEQSIDKQKMNLDEGDELSELVDEINVLKLTTRKAIDNDKLAQVGKVTSAVTHELKNPLSIIKSSQYFLD